MYKNYCKICGISRQTETSVLFFPLFVIDEDTHEMYYTRDGSMFTDCLFADVYPDTKYPEVICETCHQKLSEFNEFRELAIATHDHITELLNDNDATLDEENKMNAEVVSNVIEEERIDINNDNNIDYNSDTSNGDQPQNIEQTDVYLNDDRDQIEVKFNIADKTKLFRCKSCLLVFDESKQLEEHMNEHPTCPICGQTFIKQKSFDAHLTRHAIEAMPEQKLDISESIHSQMLLDVLTGKNCEDDKDGIIVYDPITINDVEDNKFSDDNKNSDNSLAIGIADGKKMFQCKICHRMYLYKRNLDLHLMQRHKGVSDETHEVSNTIRNSTVTYQCELCERTYMTKRTLTAHLKTHSVKIFNSNEEFPCTICNHVSSTKRGLSEHLIKRHVPTENDETENIDQKLLCPICHRTYSNRKNLNFHLNNHDRPLYKRRPLPQRYVCTTCGKKFSIPSVLREHEFRHKNEYPVKCEICNKHFKMNKDLEIHNRTHTGERKFICDICGKCFFVNRQLRDHKESHSKVPLYECKLCFKKLKTRISYKSHLALVHKKNRQFKCGLCSVILSYRNCALRHMKIHVKKGHITRDQIEHNILVHELEQ